MYEKLCEAVMRAKATNTFLLLHINSVGGYTKWALKMHKLLFYCKYYNIETHAAGYQKVHSVALFVYLSCVFRVAYQETQFLIHRAVPVPGDTKASVTRADRITLGFLSEITDVSLPEAYELANAHTYLSYDYAKQKKIINFEWNKGSLTT